MIVRVPEVEDLRHEVARGRFRANILGKIRGIALDAAIDLACWRYTLSREDALLVDQTLEEWTREHSSLRRAWSALTEGAGDEMSLHATPANEIRSTPARHELESELSPWHEFLLRFRRSLIERGRSDRQFADALCRALTEMVDNVVQHSGSAAEPAAGLVGYQVADGRARYAVGDVGRGILASLRSVERHAALIDSQVALCAAVEGGATRRLYSTSGDGFRQVLRALADVGSLRFRSGDGQLTISTVGPNRVGATSSSVPMPGLQLSVEVTWSTLSKGR